MLKSPWTQNWQFNYRMNSTWTKWSPVLKSLLFHWKVCQNRVKKDYHKFHFMLTLCRSMGELTIFYFIFIYFLIFFTPGCANIWFNVIILHSLALPVNCNSTINCPLVSLLGSVTLERIIQILLYQFAIISLPPVVSKNSALVNMSRINLTFVWGGTVGHMHSPFFDNASMDIYVNMLVYF